MKLTKILFTLSALAISMTLAAQCETWEGSPKKETAENAHTVYREALKAEDYALAFENWKVAYEIAPSADGKRDYHFTDGAKIYAYMAKNEADAAKKKEYSERALALYDEAVSCYKAGKIVPSKCEGNSECIDQKIEYVYSKKGYDMFYTLNSPYAANLEAYDKAIANGGKGLDYTFYDPISSMVVYQFQNGKMDKDQVLEYWNKMEDVAEYHAVNNERLGEYFTQAWESAKGKFGPIEADIFDCDYFRPKYEELYMDNPDDMDNVKNLLALLKKRGCPDEDPLVMKLDGIWTKYAKEVNAERQAEFEQNNPSFMAKKLYDNGDFSGAVAKYDEAIAGETDPEKKAKYYFSKASIEFRKLKQYSKARSSARKAAELKPNWGRPFMLIGDMYGSSARSCGDSWNQRLAILAAVDKYQYAKSIDPSVADEANQRISKYRASFPEQQDGFMRSVSAGQTQTVGCWIGETVKVRFK